MSFIEILRQAYSNMKGNLLRSMLTLMIISFGIMALVGILTAIDTITFSLNDSFSGLGANSFTIQPKEEQGRQRGLMRKTADPISYQQATEFKQRFDFPAKVALSFPATSTATVKFGENQTNPNISLVGIDENYVAVNVLSIEHGRSVSSSEVEDGQARALLGMEVAKILFEEKPENAVDKTILMNGIRLRVVGVLAEKGASMGQSADRAVYVPLSVVKAAYGKPDSNYEIVVAADDQTSMEAAISVASGLFRVVRGLRPDQKDDFESVNSNTLAGLLAENTATLRIATIAIGLMTLFGAAIGLMNIMLVSVTERTREIGVYKALGAPSRTILIQFLAESVLICQLGGIVGIILGILIGNVVTLIIGGKFLIPWMWMLLGFVMCMIVGVVSGYYPALKASRLDPIEALRYE